MKGYSVFHLALFAVLSGGFILASETPTEDDSAVLVLNKSNFSDTLKENEIVLVKFYAPWCGHCKRMAPEFAKAAKMLKDKGSKVVLGKVDATEETELANTHDVNEFPTLTLFRNEKPEKYTGGRTAETIIEWIETMTGPAVLDLEGDIKEKVTKEALVAFFGEFASKDSEMAKMFETVANESRQLGKFYATYDSSSDKISAVRYEEGSYRFEGKTNAEFKKFVEEESFPLFGPINGDNFRKYIERDAALVWFCGVEKDFDDFKAAIREAAKESRNTYYFVWLDTDTFKGHAEGALGVTEFPGLVAQTKKGRYLLPDPSKSLKDSTKVAQFLRDVTDGKIERSLKSDPVPETNDEVVKVVVGKTFESMVISDKDVFLEVYAPWCGYCKSFEPIYKEFAEKIKDNENVVVAKMDGTSNESPLDAFDWNSFPSIFFVKAGEKTPMKYDGSRTVDGLMEFLEKNASKPIAPKVDKGEEL